MNVQSLYQRWFSFWDVPDNYPNGSMFKFFLRIISMVILYKYLIIVLFSTTQLSFQSYSSNFMVLAFFKELFQGLSFLYYAPLVLILIVFWKNIFISWNKLSNVNAIRIIVTSISFVLAWIFSTYDYDLFVNQGHLLDRSLLIILVALIWFRPFFLIPYLIILFIVNGQIANFGIYPWGTFQLSQHLVITVTVFYLFYLITKKIHLSDFIFFIGCIIAMNYWHSGLQKATYEWIMYDKINYLTSVTYANGWLNFLSAEQLSNFINQLMPFNGFFKLVVVVLELGVIFLLWHRKLARFFLAGFICFHIGTFVFFGIGLWSWIIADAVILYFIWKKESLGRYLHFNIYILLFSCLLIFLGQHWNRVTTLSWSSSLVGYTYIFEATDENDNTYHLPPQFFDPYYKQFTLNNFKFLQKEPRVQIFWGATSEERASKLRKQQSIEAILEYEAQEGKVFYKEKDYVVFEDFLKRFIGNWNKRLSKKNIFSIVKAPEHVWTFPRNGVPKGMGKIKKIKITELTTVFFDGKHQEIRKQPVYELDIQ